MGYRCDERCYCGGTDFDPMLAKVISFAPNRIDAASKLAKALESTHIGGVKNK